MKNKKEFFNYLFKFGALILALIAFALGLYVSIILGDVVKGGLLVLYGTVLCDYANQERKEQRLKDEIRKEIHEEYTTLLHEFIKESNNRNKKDE